MIPNKWVTRLCTKELPNCSRMLNKLRAQFLTLMYVYTYVLNKINNNNKTCYQICAFFMHCTDGKVTQNTFETLLYTLHTSKPLSLDMFVECFIITVFCLGAMNYHRLFDGSLIHFRPLFDHRGSSMKVI